MTKPLPASSSRGETRFTWDPKNTKDCQAMADVFSLLRAKGKLIFVTTEDGGLGEPLTEFQKDLGRMTVLPSPTLWDRVRENAQ